MTYRLIHLPERTFPVSAGLEHRSRICAPRRVPNIYERRHLMP